MRKLVVRYARGDALDRYDSDAPFRPPVAPSVVVHERGVRCFVAAVDRIETCPGDPSASVARYDWSRLQTPTSLGDFRRTRPRFDGSV